MKENFIETWAREQMQVDKLTVEQFADKLRERMDNPHTLTTAHGKMFLFTKDRELVEFEPPAKWTCTMDVEHE